METQEITQRKPKTYLNERFAKWLKQTHPDLELYEWQIIVINIFCSQPVGSGRTTLIDLLREFDR